METDDRDELPTCRLHGLEEPPDADYAELWRALAADERLCCRACGGRITIERLEGQPLWRAAWPPVRCPRGCTLIERKVHVNLWPDM